MVDVVGCAGQLGDGGGHLLGLAALLLGVGLGLGHDGGQFGGGGGHVAADAGQGLDSAAKLAQGLVDVLGQLAQFVVAFGFGAHVEATEGDGVHHLLQLADGLDDATGEPPAAAECRDQGGGHQQQGLQQGGVVVGLLLGYLLLDQLIDVGREGVNLLDQLLSQLAKTQPGLLIAGGLGPVSVLLGQQWQHVAAGVAEIGLQGRRHLAVVLLGPGDHQPGQEAAYLLLGGIERAGQLGEAGLIVEAVDGIGAQPVGGVDQGGDVILVAGDAGGGVVHVLDGTVYLLLADHGHEQHQQAGEQ
ncbi:hypothetical protein D3C75_503700 [compost metagenome]